MKFLIVDGYPKKSRDEFEEVGMTVAFKLYANILKKYIPEAEYDVLLPSDPGSTLPQNVVFKDYTAVLWTGCNQTVYLKDVPGVLSMVEIAKMAYAQGVPSYGSCWGLQIAAYAAGGDVQAHPKGREMGISRKIHLTKEGQTHPLMKGKPLVFDAFTSHDDQVVSLPEGATILASNYYSKVQALAVTHKGTTFWSTQYHTEYNLFEMARLLLAREKKLIKGGFFKDEADLKDYSTRMEQLHKEPERKDLRWQLAIGDDIIEQEVRECEFRNWVDHEILKK